MKIFLRLLAACLLVGFLAGCDTAEERAEKHYQSALSLIDSGDEERAIIEFRNVFKLNGTHRDARAAYANLQRSRGNLREAIGQYLLLVEQFPEDIEGLLSIAELYAEIGNWPEMERFLLAAQDGAADNIMTKALQQIYNYRQGLEASDAVAIRSAVDAASDLINDLPNYVPLREVVIDDRLKNADFPAALLGLAAAIRIDPDKRALYAVRLSVLAAMEDYVEIENQLKEMIMLFPDDKGSRSALVRWYVSQSQFDEAEVYLRGASKTGNVEDQLILIRFLEEFRSTEAAQAELEAIIDADGASPLLYSLRAGYEFDAGNADKAVGQLQDLLAGLEPGEETETVQIALSRMLELNGDPVGARAQIEDVLKANSYNVEALKTKAGWLIAEDQVGDAIGLLRSALERDSRDADILTMLAHAHQRDGNQDLVGEMLSLAVDASKSAPEESVRYARYLSDLSRFGPAETVLVDALRLAPDNLSILVQLGSVYLGSSDWARAEQVQATMVRIGTDSSIIAGNELKARLLQAQQRTSEAVTFLKGLVAEGFAGFEANVAIIQNHLDNGEPDKAREHVQNLLAENPEDAALRFLDATLDVAMDDPETAEHKYRSLLNDDAQQPAVWVALYRVLAANGKIQDAAELIDAGREALPDDPTLKWINAGLLESRGEVEAAIEIYEDMYARDSENPIIANNLASLLSTNTNDAETLERAFAIAKRLRSVRLAPYQDTYGWISYLRGDVQEAVKALEFAASGMAEDPVVQYHLAKAYLAADEPRMALAQFQSVVRLTGAADSRDFVEESRHEINRLQADGSSK